jgi:hypothetical protein
MVVLWLGLFLASGQSIWLNEVQSSNDSTLLDENGDAPDWLELFNPGPGAVNLNGWGLSDSTNALFKWTFTNAPLPAGSFMLVFASGKDRQPANYPAVNPATLSGLRVWLRAASVDTADATQVRNIGGTLFVKSWRDQSGSAFHAGQTVEANQPRYLLSAPELGGRPALRFDGADDLLTLPVSPAANSFTLVTVARPTAGHEIDPAGAAGVGGVSGQRYLFGAQHGGDFNSGAGLSVGTNGASVYEHGSSYMPALAVVASPLMSAPSVISLRYLNRQPALTVNGTLNALGPVSPRATVTAPVEIGAGTYGAFAGDVAEILLFDRALTDTELRGLEVFLRDQYGLAFPEVRHTNFSIDKDGEKLFLTRPDGTLADWLPSVEIPRGLSWGRQADGSTNLLFFARPTPGTNNSTPGATEFLKMPKFSLPAGFYTTNVTVALLATNHPPGTSIRYTRDGSDPSETSPIYTNPLGLGPRAGTPNDISQIPTAGGWQPPAGEVFKLHVLRVRAFRTNAIPSEVNTASYCVDPRGRGRYSLPVVSLSTDRRNFFDPNIGIYVCGNTPGCNYAQSGDLWERPCHVEMFETNGVRVLDQKSGVRMHGNTSFGFPIKALRLHPLNQQGSGPFNYRIFPDLNVDKFYRLLLRPSGHDHYLTMMRDGLMQGLMRETGIDMQGYRPAILFLNGEYWGVHNLQEAFDEHYFAQHYPSVDPDAVDYIEGYAPGAAPQNGDATHFHNLIAFMTTNSLAVASNYAWVQTQMEVDNYIDYKASETFYCRWDIGNHRLWRPHTADGRWRWIIFDQDVGYGGFWQQPTAAPWTFPMLAYNLEPNGPWTNYQPGNDHNAPPLTFQLRTLLTNTEFKRAWVNRFADLMNSTLSETRMSNFIARLAGELAPEMAEHCARWRSPASWGTWSNNVAWLHQFAANRHAFQRQELTNRFALRGLVNVTLRVNDTNAGAIRWSTLTLAPPTNAPWTGVYFRDNPVTFSAQAARGFQFKNWQGLAGPPATNLTNTLTLSAPLSLTAVFEALPATNAPVPAPHELAGGPYLFTRWDSSVAAGVYPAHLLFTQTATNAAPDPGLNAELPEPWLLPYDRTNRTRINGLGDDGVAFLNTSDPQPDGGGYVGGAVLGLTTSGVTNVLVTWRGGTVIANSRLYAIQLQYRVGNSNDFLPVLDATGRAVEYLSATTGHSAVPGPIRLPAACENQPYVQLRWKYYWVSGTNGARAQLRLDDIVVSGGALPSPGLTSIRFLGGSVAEFGYSAQPGLSYTLESSPDLRQWTPISVIPSTEAGLVRFQVTPGSDSPSRFYRLRWP